MKTKSFIALGMAAALAAGCSSDDIVDDGGNNGGSNGSGKAFVSLNITLPSSAGTRSNDETFNQGSPSEYSVKTVKITYYADEAGTAVSDIKEYTAADLAWDTPVSTASGITTKALLPVDEVKFNGEAWALVEVNTPEGLTVNATNEAQSATVKQLIGADKSSFFMTNTVQANGKCLVKVRSYLKKTEAQAHAGENSIYVERAVAKVDLNVGNGGAWSNNTYTIQSTDGINAGSTVTIANWQLDVTNNKMFAIRKFKGLDTYTNEEGNRAYKRFYGAMPYRTYWAEDPNYGNDAAVGELNIITDSTKITNTVGANEYCLENTFDTKHQKHSQTTRALIKAVYTPKAAEGNTIKAGDTWYLLGNSTLGYSADGVKKIIADALSEGKQESDKVSVDAIALTGAFLTAGTQVELTSDVPSFTINGSNPNDAQLAAVKNRTGKVTTYVNGICFYEIRIKHLANDCPWGSETDAPKFGAVPTEYVDYVNSDANPADLEVAYLGRYGVVRNNWYQINIRTISQPGTPTVPEATEECDDQQKYYLQATINILDWAVRTQTEDL